MRKISVRIDEQTYEQLLQEAEQSELKLSDVVRAKLGKKLPTQKTIPKEILYELNRIGSNLNQIARYANTKKTLDIVVLEQLKIVEDLIKRCIDDL